MRSDRYERNRSTRALRAGRGFTLVEIAIILAVIALLIGSVVVPLTTQVERRQVSETENALAEIKEALIGFALANGYLPCPDRTSGGAGGVNDTANDGVEDFNTGTGICFSTTATGNVPWVTLGVSASDAWGNRFRYRVDTNFSRRPPAVTPPPAPFDLTSAAVLSVCTTTAGGCLATSPPRLTSTTAGDGAVAVILSHGRNGYGAIKASTGTANPPPPASNQDEADNLGGSTYVSRTQTGIRTPCSDTVAGQPLCEFDDITIWLGKFTLFQRMVAAGRVP